MSVFDRFFGKGRTAVAAERAALRGDLARAAELWGQAGRPEEAARVMILRGDAETSAPARMQHYLQAIRTAPAEHAVHKEARTKRALLSLAMASGGGALSAVARQDLLVAAKELEEVGEPTRAAEAYRIAGDRDGEARALTAAGDVDTLETLLATEQDKERRARERHDKAAEIELLVQSGRRREALVAADALAKAYPDERLLTERADGLRARRVSGSVVDVVLEGRPVTLALGEEIVVGRTEGDIRVSSHAVSRRHLRIGRDAGAPVVADLGSRNGTHLRGVRLAGALAVGDGIAIDLGNEVHVKIAPASELPGAVSVEIAGARYVAPLGPARLPIGDWRLETASDGWLELVTAVPPAFANDVSLVGRATLLAGDAVSMARGGPPVLTIAQRT